MSHDYCHCANKDCHKADKCYRAFLAQEDKRLLKERPGKPMWCGYAMFSPDENGNCENYLEK